MARARQPPSAAVLRPVNAGRIVLVVAALAVGVAAAFSTAWPLALLLAAAAFGLDRPAGSPFGLQRAGALVALETDPPRRSWRRYLPLERAGPDVVLVRPLNGLLLVALLASMALAFADGAMLALTVVLASGYACLGRPERAFVPRRAVRTYLQLAATEASPMALAPGAAAGRAPGPGPAPQGLPAAFRHAPFQPAPLQPAPLQAPRGPSRWGVFGPRPPSSPLSLPVTGPAIVARIDATARDSRGLLSADAMAALWRIRQAAVAALPTDDRVIDTTHHETWLVRQVACVDLPTAIDRYRAVTPALRARPLADGRTPTAVLAASLAMIERFLRDAAVRAYERDTAALVAHERFLAERLVRTPGLKVDGAAADEPPSASA